MSADNLLDPVNHPTHYTAHPSGVECITITEHMNFNVGNAVKHLWRADLKNGLEDLEKAAWYVNREIARLRTMESEARARLEALAEFAPLSTRTLPVVGHENAEAFAADLRALLADRDAAVAALREIGHAKTTMSGYWARRIARTYLARLEPEKTDAG